jgi:hypothetical protein
MELQQEIQGLTAAKGEIRTFLDDDDYYRPDKIEKTSTIFMRSSIITLYIAVA